MHRNTARAGFVLAVMIWIAAGCGGKEVPPAPTTPEGATLYLSQAVFTREVGEDGKSMPVPGPARLVIFTKKAGGWSEEILEDAESNVFHKAAWYTPPAGEPGILTIGGTEALLKIWRRDGGEWKAETLWNPSWGGKIDRLRDYEVADVTGNGVEDIVVATHDQGVMGVVSWSGESWEATEFGKKPQTFVHEVEVGDVDGDGMAEIFATPSRPNKMDGTIQPGEIDMWDLEGSEWVRREVDILETRHAKEILCVTLTGEQTPVLLASLEGEGIGGGPKKGDTTRIRLYRFGGDEIAKEDLIDLPGKLCRFLTYGDTDGDGQKELIASTKSDGIWKITRADDGSWEKELVATGTGGFEHATYLFDFDGDGRQEIYVASDDQQELRCYRYGDGTYTMEVIGPLREKPITFNVTAGKAGR